MTEPTDSEILDAADDFRSQYMHGGITFDDFDSIGFARAVLAKWGTPQPAQAQAVAVLTADDLKQPRNGKQWRVEWWNESCRMLLPVDKKLDRFQAYRTGTLMFTIKDKPGIKGGQHDL